MTLIRKWWKEGIIYQIYPRSFQDSNGDGIGDLRGIINRLDYISDLGVDIIWINPIYQSPNDDNGYDISDYYSIHPEYGDMADFDELLSKLHDRNIRLIMDVVINHTSDEHPWFQSSATDPEGEFGDFYFWKEGRQGGPPNNWPSFFGGSAWEYHAARGAYYLHLFSKKQPDLNWENPNVREACKAILKFWLEKGVDGFRLDVIPLISKRLDFVDTDLSDFGKIVEEVYSNGPKVHEYLQEIHKDVFQDYDIMTVGEGPGITQQSVNLYVGKSRQELDMIFQLDHMAIDHGPEGRFDRVPFDFITFKRLLSEWDDAVGSEGWLSAFLDNHDFPRMLSRFADDRVYRVESAKLLGMLILTQRGTPCLYFGSEIGMTNVDFDRIEDYRDVETHNFHQIYLSQGTSEEDFLNLVATQGRDNVRTPMQWNADLHAGFTTGQPWINVNPNYHSVNVTQDRKDERSVFAFYQKMIALRKKEVTLTYGEYRLLLEDHPSIYAYERSDDENRFLILLNFSAESCEIPITLDHWSLKLSNYVHKSKTPRYLGPWEGRLFQVRDSSAAS